MDWVFAIFFVIIILLRGINWFVQQLKGSEQAPLPGQAKAPATQPRKETPLQSMLRMLEEASGEEQQREVQRRQRAQPRPRPRPRSRPAEPPVLKAKRVEQPASGRVADRSRLRSAIGDRHVGTRRGADRLTGLDRRPKKKDVENHFWKQLETRTPLQRAVILMEVLGPPRSARITQRHRRTQAF